VVAEIDDDQAIEAVRLGVRGIVLKEMPSRLLIQCIRKVHGGGIWLEKESFGHAFEKLLKRDSAVREMSDVLTPREIEVVRMIAGGLQNKEIADGLYVSEATIRTHLYNIHKKLKVNSRTQLVQYTRDKGLV